MLNQKITKAISFLLLIFIVFTSIISCTKDEDHNDHTKKEGTITLKLDHLWRPNMPFYVDASKTYTLQNGQDVTFTEFRYYITNIQLKRADGTWWTEEESYRIADASIQEHRLSIDEVPEGEYTAIRYMIGVDSVRNFSGVQEGALAPSHGMFWSWNTGYIFVRVEGNSSAVQTEDNAFQFHIGGFQGPNAGIRIMEQEFGRELRVRRNAAPSIHFHVFINRFFEGESIQIDLSTLRRQHMVNETSRRIADNYANMIELDHIHN